MNWAGLTLRSQVTIVVVAGLFVVQILSVAIDIVEIRDAHHAEMRNRGSGFLAQMVPRLARTPPDARAAALAGFDNDERIAEAGPRNGVEAMREGHQHTGIADWFLTRLRAEGLPVADLSVGDRSVRIADGPAGVFTEFPALAGLGTGSLAERGVPPRPTVGVYAVRLEGDATWYNFYLLMAPIEFWPIFLERSLDSMLAIGLFAVVVLLVGRVMRPLRALTTSAERLGRGEETDALEPRGSADVRDTVVAFNRMQARILQAIDYQVALLRSLAHDLAGPLARLRDAEGAVEPPAARQRLLERQSRVEAIVGSIASFTRATRRDGATERIDLPTLLEALVDEQVDSGADATIRNAAPAIVGGRHNALTRAFGNLIDNAIKYGGSVAVTLSVVDGSAVVDVDDAGPGIAAEQVEAAFQPFQRLGAAGPGSGLGLAIVRAIVVDHGGTVRLANRPEGGLRATVTLPLEAPDQPGRKM